MGKITGGEVKYGRTVKTGDFENKRVDVALYFSVDDGEDHGPLLQTAAKEAHDKAHAMLGIKPASAQAAELVQPPKGQKEAAAAALNAKEAPKGKAPGKPKPEKPEPRTPADHPLPDHPPHKPAPLPDHPPPPAEAPVEAGEDLGFDEDAPEAQPEVTDAALTLAANRKIGALRETHGEAAGKHIKGLIGTFVEAPKKMHDIPQNLRAEFLKKLEGLK